VQQKWDQEVKDLLRHIKDAPQRIRVQCDVFPYSLFRLFTLKTLCLLKLYCMGQDGPKTQPGLGHFFSDIWLRIWDLWKTRLFSPSSKRLSVGEPAGPDLSGQCGGGKTPPWIRCWKDQPGKPWNWKKAHRL